MKRLKRIGALLLLFVLLTSLCEGPFFTQTKAVSDQGYIWPLDATWTNVTSERGWRWLNGKYAFHAGIDIASVEGASIYAAKDGKVIETGFNNALGNFVRIEHNDGLRTQYQHMTNILTSVGTYVSAGEVIGTVGHTGESYGDHLHFEVITYPYAYYTEACCQNPRNYVVVGDTEVKRTPEKEYLRRCSAQQQTYAEVKVIKSCSIRDMPCSEKTANECGLSGTRLDNSVPKGRTYTAISYVRNSVGNDWLKVLLGEGKTGWIYAGDVQFVRYKNPITINNLSLSKTSISMGGYSTVQGSVSCAVSGLNYDLTSFYSDGRTSYSMGCAKSSSIVYNLANSDLDRATKFNLMNKVGNYEFYITAIVDVSYPGKGSDFIETTSAKIPFAIGTALAPIQDCSAAKVYMQEENNGCLYGIECVNGGEQLKSYTIKRNGAIVHSGGGQTSTTYRANIAGTYVITATVSRSGYRDVTTERTFVLRKQSTPHITDSQTAYDSKVTITADAGATIYYTTDGSTPTTSSKRYTGTFSVESRCTVKAIAVARGTVNSDYGVSDVVPVPPSRPTVSRTCKAKIAQEDPFAVSWQSVDLAAKYIVTLYKGDTAVRSTETAGCTAAFPLQDTGVYTIRVKAVNFAGESGESIAVACESMPPVDVEFTDWDGTILERQSVRYGYAAKAPVSPSRRGHTFRGWGSRGLYDITEDMTFTAQYDVNYYTVKFYSDRGSLLSKQSVRYLSPAEEPSYTPSEGYVFTGWTINAAEADSACDLSAIDSDMTVMAVQSWENYDLPVIAAITSAERYTKTEDNYSKTHYEVKVDLTGPENESVVGLLRVSLKNDAGQLIKTTSREVEIKTGLDEPQQEVVTAVCNDVASTAEVEFLGIENDTKTGSAYSKAVSAVLVDKSDETWGDWSDWSEIPAAPGDNQQVDSKTQYRSRTKITTTSSFDHIDGDDWTLSDSSFTWGDYGGWSNWSNVEIKGSDSTNVQTRSVYQYYYYVCPSCGMHTYNPGKNACYEWMGGCGSDVPETSYRTTLSTTAYTATSEWYKSGVSYTYATDAELAFAVTDADSPDFVPMITQYRYQTRNKNYTYTFYRWGKWSEWGDIEKVASSTQEVETRAVYRTRTKGNPSMAATAETYYVSGMLTEVQEDLAGKVATIMVYNTKNSDPNEDQLQYIGQTTIQKNNVYSFSFIPKTDPGEDTGDFVVALGLEGSTGLVNVDVIAAPKPTYTVTYLGMDGKVLSQQDVSEGENAAVPNAPEQEGYTFVSWSGSSTNIHDDKMISAIYMPKSYTVIYVDWVNDQLGYENSTYNTKVTAPYTPSREGYTFNGWKMEDGSMADDELTVTGNMVLTADYTPETYTVTFLDGNGHTFAEQKVNYGESATLPETMPEAPEDKAFLGWSNDGCWWNVTENISVEPILVYGETAKAPSYTIEEQEGAIVLELSSEEENAELYYASASEDNFTQVQGQIGYSDLNYEVLEERTDDKTGVQEITVRQSANLVAYAAVPGKNDSAVIPITYTKTYTVTYDPNEMAASGPKVSVGAVAGAPGKTVTIPVTIQNNTGVAAYLLSMTYDTNALTYQGTTWKNTSGETSVTDEKDASGAVIGKKFTYVGSKNITEDGELFEVTFQVKDNVTENQKIELTYSAENTVDEEGQPIFWNVAGNTLACGLILGDVDLDGEVTNADAVLLLRYLVDLETLSDIQKKNADVDQDGALTIADASKIIQSLIGLNVLEKQ